MSESCYMCDKTQTSVEHVPPKCLFPEKKDLPANVDLRKQLITVPSCDEHNTSKSKDDEYLLYCLVMSIPSNKIGNNHFLTKLMRTIRRKPKLINRLLSNSRDVVVKDTKTSKVENSIAVQIDETRLHDALEQVSRALYFHHYNEKWLGNIKIYSNFLLSMEMDNSNIINTANENIDKLANELFRGFDYHGKNPDVFKYQLADGSAICHKVLRLYFYNGNRVTVLIG